MSTSTKEISDIVWFDEISKSVIIAFDNITVTFTYEEFFYFIDSLKKAERVLNGNSTIDIDDDKTTQDIYFDPYADEDIDN